MFSILRSRLLPLAIPLAFAVLVSGAAPAAEPAITAHADQPSTPTLAGDPGPAVDAALGAIGALVLNAFPSAPGKPEAYAPSRAIVNLPIQTAPRYRNILISPGSQWYSFQVPSRQTLLASVSPYLGTLTPFRLRLYGPNSQTALLADRYAPNNSTPAEVVAQLDPGTYYLEASLSLPGDTAMYDVWVENYNPPAPYISKVVIANGIFELFYPQVMIDLTCSGYPTEMIISEARDFAGAAWQPYRSHFAFTLSPGAGKKIVYVKVRAFGKISTLASSWAWLRQIKPLAVDGRMVTATLSGSSDAAWYYFDVKTEGRYDIAVKGLHGENHYLYLLGPNRRDLLIAACNDWFGSKDPRIITALKPGRYYAKVLEIDGAPSTFGISVGRNDAPLIVSYTINDNSIRDAGESYVRRVTLYSTVVADSGALYYRASEKKDFTGASWQTYSPRAGYYLTAVDGYKRVYFQAKDSAGRLSAIWSDDIMLYQKRPIQLNQALSDQFTISGPNYDRFYEFTVTQQGQYEAELVPATPAPLSPGLQGYFLGLNGMYTGHEFYGGVTGRFAATLNPGTYMIRLGLRSNPLNLFSNGGYTLRVWRYSGAPLVTYLWPYGEYTRSRTWSFGPEYAGTATQYMISTRSDFSGASWVAYANLQPYAYLTTTLASGSGDKKLYFKLRDAQGRVSNVLSQSVYLTETRALTIGAAAAQYWFNDLYPLYFSFTVATAGTYTIQTSAGSSSSCARIENLQLQREGKNFNYLNPVTSTTGAFPVKRYALQPGKYEIYVNHNNAAYPLNTGNFKIRVYK